MSIHKNIIIIITMDVKLAGINNVTHLIFFGVEALVLVPLIVCVSCSFTMVTFLHNLSRELSRLSG